MTIGEQCINRAASAGRIVLVQFAGCQLLDHAQPEITRFRVCETKAAK